MSTTAAEQYLLELINDARLDPAGNAARYLTSYSTLTSSDPDIQNALDYFHVSGSALKAQFAALKPVPPLAYNGNLAAAAAGHDKAMIAADEQSHQLPGEAALGDRFAAHGYQFHYAGENIYAYAQDPLYAHAGFMIDWGPGADGMQDPPGHRENIMSADFREIGVAIKTETDPSTAVGPQVVTEDFGSRFNDEALILGVAYTDKDKDHFYSIGEGKAGLKVAIGTAHTASGTSGGYTLASSALGAQSITLSGAGLDGTVSVATTLTSTTNIKIDVVGGTVLDLSGSATISGHVATIQALGTIGLKLSTDDLAHTLIGGKGNDTLTTGSAADALSGGNGGDVLDGRRGKDTLAGGKGKDTFVFDTAIGATNLDHIVDFSVKDDTIRLAAGIFKGLSTGTLATSAFKDVTSATAKLDGNDRILYDHTTGALFFDKDGDGFARAIQFAMLDTHPTLTAKAFQIV